MAQKNGGPNQEGRKEQPTQAPAQQAPRRPPVAEWRLGLCKIACWENQTEQGIRYSFSLTRSYKDNQGQWQQSGPISLNRDDLALVEKLCHLAYVFVYSPRGERDEA